MHNNYYFLRQLSKQLRHELTGFKIGEIFSQARDELVLMTYKGKKEKFIKAHLAPFFCCLSFPKTFQRARKNSVDLFKSVTGYEILDIIQVNQDRSFYFLLNDSFHFLFKMHGNRSNVILMQDERVIEVFKKNLKQDFSVRVSDLERSITLDKSTFEALTGDYKKIVPTLGKAFDPFFADNNYEKMDMDQKYDHLINLLNDLENPAIYLHQSSGQLPGLTLLRTGNEDQRMEDPITALNLFYQKYISTYHLEMKKKELKHSFISQIKKGESYIRKSMNQLKKLNSASSYQHIGDLIMANLHAIKPRSAEIEVMDFYTQQPIKIRLNPNLSAPLNAEKYYRKAKRQQIEIDTLNNNISQKQEQIQTLNSQLMEVDKIADLKQLGKKKLHKQVVIDLPYHHFSFMDHDIFIGKNARKNEQLTFKIAKKDDLFLHAKDASGSHVIVRKKMNQNFPKPVIERAASIAAYFSKNGKEPLCRVLFTPKKHVRKAKGASAGTVIVEREKVILVKPMNFRN